MLKRIWKTTEFYTDELGEKLSIQNFYESREKAERDQLVEIEDKLTHTTYGKNKSGNIVLVESELLTLGE